MQNAVVSDRAFLMRPSLFLLTAPRQRPVAGKSVWRSKLLSGGVWLFLWFAVAGGVVAAFPTLYLKPVVLQQLDSPTNLVAAGDGTDRLFVTDQPGRIHVIADGMLRPTPFLDLTDRVIATGTVYSERGLLGLAFHPGYGNAASPGYRKFYVYYSKAYVAGTDPGPPLAGEPVDHVSVLSEFQVSTTNGNVALPGSERRLLVFTQPQNNHNGGQLAFGPDGYLYLGLGDGGGAGDTGAGHQTTMGNSQDMTRLYGKMLRLDPLGSNGPGGQYGVPADNPFVGAGGGVRAEIWALGLRNPWRFSFDVGPGGTGRLFCCDVGQNRIEEVNLITKGGNYGWRIKEGSFDFNATSPNTSGVPLTPPVAEYGHPGATGLGGMPLLGLSGTGGYVYRGAAIPSLQGKYVFGDYGATGGAPSGRLMGLEETAPGSGVFTLTQAIPLLGGNPFSLRILCLGQDAAGELYVGGKMSGGVRALENGLPNGGIFKLVPVPANVTVLEPSRDATLFSASGDVANSRGPLFAGNSAGDVVRPMLAFDLSSQAADARYASVYLQLQVSQVGAGNPSQRNTFVNRITESWMEGNASSASGSTAATLNDPTWMYRSYSPTSPLEWNAEGGTFSGTTSASGGMGGLGVFGWQNAQLTADVHGWLANAATNHGWILRSDEGTTNASKTIGSRESAVGQRPQLTLVPVSPYQRWLARYYPSVLLGAFLDPQGDGDGDSISNQLEYAYGLNPTVKESALVNHPVATVGAVTVSGGGPRRVLSMTFKRDVTAADLTYQLQISDDLIQWVTVATSVDGQVTVPVNGAVTSSVESSLGGGRVEVTVTHELAAPAILERHFVRLQVLRQP